MLFYCNSKAFQKFINTESYKDILETQYVLVSTRIFTKGKRKNIINAMNILYPDPNVCVRNSKYEVENEYKYEQLTKAKPFIASLIKASIKKYNIIFLSSQNEDRWKFLQYLSEFIYTEFDYPCYEYDSYSKGVYKLLPYNKDKVLKKCNKIIKESKKERINNLKKDNDTISHKKLIEVYKDSKKSELIKLLKDMNAYEEGMSKKEMIETLDLLG